MTRSGYFAFLLLIASAASGVSAQDFKIGNGRLLKKWREDVFGSDKDSKANTKQNQPQPTLADPVQRPSYQLQSNGQNSGSSQSRSFFQSSQGNQFRQPVQGNVRQTPTRQQQPYQTRMEAQQRAEFAKRQQAQQTSQGNRQRQAQPASTAGQPDYYRQRGAPGASRTGQASQSAVAPQQFAPQPQFQTPPANFRSVEPAVNHNPALSNQAQQAAARLNATKNAKRRGPPAVGFGMELRTDKNQKIYVADLDRNGNAANAGIRKGDYVSEIGGVELGSIEEFDEIVKVMNNGDQLELKISRRGKESEVMLTFGEAQEEADLPVTEVPLEQEQPGQLEFDSASSPRQGERFDFVPAGRGQTPSTGPVVNPGAFDAPAPPESVPAQDNERPELPELDLELPEIPTDGSEIDR